MTPRARQQYEERKRQRKSERIWKKRFAAAMGRCRADRYAESLRRLHDGEPPPREPLRLPLAGHAACDRCGDTINAAEVTAYGGLCENCFAAAAAARQDRDAERRLATDNTPKCPAGFRLRRGQPPGVQLDETVDYFGDSQGR